MEMLAQMESSGTIIATKVLLDPLYHYGATIAFLRNIFLIALLR